MQKLEGFEITEHKRSKRIIDIKIEDEILDKLIFPFNKFDITALEYKPFTRFTIAKSLDNLTKKLSLIFELIFFGPIIKQPVFLSLTIKLRSLLNLLTVRSSKLFAIVNRVKGLYSRAIILNLLNGNINLSKISSSI